MRLRTLLRNGASLSLVFPTACALFPSRRGCTPKAFPTGRPSGLQTPQLFSLHRIAAYLPSLFPLLCPRFLCFQSLAASFPKTPGWAYPVAHLPSRIFHSRLQPQASILQPRSSRAVILSATPVPRAYCAIHFSPPPLPGRTEPRFRALPVS